MISAYNNAHLSDKIIVCGCGVSINQFDAPDRFITIGVNDIGRAFQPDYLVVLDGAEHLGPDRYRYVESSAAKAIFTQRTSLLRNRANVVRFRFEDPGDKDTPPPNDTREVLPHTTTSVMTPYIAMCLALYMGASTVGLIGVDLTDHHFFNTTGAHDWMPHLNSIDQRFAALGDVLLARGGRVFNLSPVSRLRAFPKLSVAAFEALPPRLATAPMHRVVHYATTPRVGVPAMMARSINLLTDTRARAVWPMGEYSSGLSFASDVNWTETPAMAKRELEAADAVIVHGGRVAPEHIEILEQKPVITVAHGEPDGMDLRWVGRGMPGLVLGQHQPAFEAFKGWRIVPSPVPLHEKAYQPEQKNHELTIAYTPPAALDEYPRDHPSYWHGKGYRRTMAILDGLAARYPIRLAVVRGGGISHAAAMAMKRRAHIVIDECVTGSFHRSSLEGLAAGCVVVNAVAAEGAIMGHLRLCAGDPSADPFIHATLDTLETVLSALIELGPDLLTGLGASGRDWMVRHWDFASQWRRFWLPAFDEAIAVAGHAECAPRGLAFTA